jgi:hypothetical protein
MPVRPRSAGHLRTAPTRRHHAGIFGVGGGPTGATDWPPPASLPHGDRRSHGPRVARTRQRARRRPPVGAYAVGDLALFSTDSRPAPIEIPIPQKIARPRQIYIGEGERQYADLLTDKFPKARKDSIRK